MLLLLDDTPAPTFDSQFLSGALPPGLTYTNSSTVRTYFGADGLLKTAAVNEPVFEYDPVTRALLGMRWEMEQRTNLCPKSEFPNGILDGGVRGGLITGVSLPNWLGRFTTGISFGHDGTTTTYIYTGNAIASTLHTFSVFVKMNDGNAPSFGSATNDNVANDFVLVIGSAGAGSPINYKVVNVGGGIYRVSASATTGDTNLANNGVVKYDSNSSRTFTVTGYQLEVGASASSYIPTAAAAVIRQPDVLTAASISPWYNQSEGTVLFEGIASTPATAQRGLYLFSDGTDNERIGGYRASTTQGGALVVDGGVTQADISTLGAISQSATFRHALAYKLNDVAGAVNGGTVGTDTSATMPTITGLKFGQGNTAGTQAYMGYARRFQYYPKALPTQIQGMSRV